MGVQKPKLGWTVDVLHGVHMLIFRKDGHGLHFAHCVLHGDMSCAIGDSNAIICVAFLFDFSIAGKTSFKTDIFLSFTVPVNYDRGYNCTII